MELNTPRGMKDRQPGEQLFRQALLSKLRDVFERYGFSPIETPVLERYDVLSAKYAGGSEILKETFTMKDQGGRELGLRYDLTVPLARFVAMNPNVKLPFKRYQIERVYRDGPIKLGRYREFYQCDCDIVGAGTAAADAQCVQLALAVFEALALPVTVEVNNVALLRSILAKDGVPNAKLTDTMLILDKLKKVGEKEVLKELKTAGIPSEGVRRIITTANLKTNEERIDALDGADGIERVREVLAIVPNVTFNPALSRGLSYYTGMVFEAYAIEGSVTSSLAGGGRYDTMIGNFVGQADKYPAVGISFGLEPIMDTLQPETLKKTTTQVYVIPIKTPTEAASLAEQLREAGLNTDTDLAGRSISKNLDYANQLGIPFVIILGQQELTENTCKLKDMTTGDEQTVSLDEIARVLRERV